MLYVFKNDDTHCIPNVCVRVLVIIWLDLRSGESGGMKIARSDCRAELVLEMERVASSFLPERPKFELAEKPREGKP